MLCNLKPPPSRKLREIPLLGEMSRSDKGVAVFARKRWHGIYAVTEGADISNTANPSFTVVGETLAVARKSERSYHADF